VDFEIHAFKLARKPRIRFPGAFYHVIACENRGDKIFHDSKDYQLYLIFLSEYEDRYCFSLYAHTLMPNHVRLLIEVGESPLSQLMQDFQFRYTRNFNIKCKKTGHLFQGRYRPILYEKDSYFLGLSAYIHLNAVFLIVVSRSGKTNPSLSSPCLTSAASKVRSIFQNVLPKNANNKILTPMITTLLTG